MSTGTLLIGATDLASLCIVEDLSDFWSSSDLRGDLDAFPGNDGAVNLSRPVSSKVASGQVTFAADTLAAAEDGVAAVKALLRPWVAQTVTRRKITGSGNLDATQTVIFRNTAERWIGDSACTLLLSAELVDGVWHGPATTISSAAGTQAILGDARTYRMTFTLAAGGPRTVTNTTNGFWFTFAGNSPSGGILVDVEARTAVAISSGIDYSGYLSWGKSYPFRLDPGSNTLTVSSGTASISYQPAYL